jgi:hypothetical protein
MKIKSVLFILVAVFLISGSAFATGSVKCIPPSGTLPPSGYDWQECIEYGTSPTGYANVFTFTPKDADLMDFDHTKFYYWGINTSNAVTQKGFNPADIVGAAVFFDNITNNDSAANILYVNLVDGKPKYIDYNNSGTFSSYSSENIGNGNTDGVDAWYWTDNQGGGNNFNHLLGDASKQVIAHTLVSTWSDTNGYPTTNDVTMTFSPAQLTALKAYLVDNIMGFGFDPDCHFYNDKVQFIVYTKAECKVPEPGTMPMLLGSALAGLAFFGRRKK